MMITNNVHLQNGLNEIYTKEKKKSKIKSNLHILHIMACCGHNHYLPFAIKIQLYIFPNDLSGYFALSLPLRFSNIKHDNFADRSYTL